MREVDLLIIGGGPAGLSTALHLIQLDASWAGRMLLIEKAAHPRPKLCGGGLTRHGLEILEALGFPMPLPIPQMAVNEARLIYGESTVTVRGRPQFVVFHRAELDAYLAQQARRRGAVLRENETAERLEVAESGVTVQTDRETYRAQAVVGADGAKGLTRKAVNGSGGKRRIARLLEVLQPAGEEPPATQQAIATFDFTPVRAALQGYFWEFPVRVEGRACFNRGIYDARCAPGRPRARLPELLRRSLASLDADPSAAPLEGHPLHWFSPRSRLSRPRLLLVGDAAGVDPLFGEGIAPALGYGKAAAQAIQRAFLRQDFSFGDYRRRFLGSPTGRYLLLRWCAAFWSYRLSGYPWFMRAVWLLGKGLAAVWPKAPPLELPRPAIGTQER